MHDASHDEFLIDASHDVSINCLPLYIHPQYNMLASWFVTVSFDTNHVFGRPWQYNEQISEYYIILEDKTLVKKSDTTRHTEETDLGDTWHNNTLVVMVLYANTLKPDLVGPLPLQWAHCTIPLTSLFGGCRFQTFSTKSKTLSSIDHWNMCARKHVHVRCLYHLISQLSTTFALWYCSTYPGQSPGCCSGWAASRFGEHPGSCVKAGGCGLAGQVSGQLLNDHIPIGAEWCIHIDERLRNTCMVIMHLKLPCQPVVDLESYMNSLEKKKAVCWEDGG